MAYPETGTSNDGTLLRIEVGLPARYVLNLTPGADVAPGTPLAALPAQELRRLRLALRLGADEIEDALRERGEPVYRVADREG
jgi:hypothetical protein